MNEINSIDAINLLENFGDFLNNTGTVAFEMLAKHMFINSLSGLICFVLFYL